MLRESFPLINHNIDATLFEFDSSKVSANNIGAILYMIPPETVVVAVSITNGCLNTTVFVAPILAEDWQLSLGYIMLD